MKVSELIEALKKLPPNWIVVDEDENELGEEFKWAIGQPLPDRHNEEVFFALGKVIATKEWHEEDWKYVND